MENDNTECTDTRIPKGMRVSHCEAETQAKKRCSKKAKICVHNKNLCWIHWTVWYKEYYKCDVVPEPWELLKMDVYPDEHHLCKKTISNIRSLLRKGIKGADPSDGNHVKVGRPGGVATKGHVYVYKMKKDMNDTNHMYKIGFTSQTVQARLLDWPGSELVESWETACPSFAESIIHAYLEHWRVRRYVLCAARTRPHEHIRFISTWYSNEDPVHDDVWYSSTCPEWMPEHIWAAIKSDTLTSEISIATKPINRYPVEIEFFYCDQFSYIHDVITTVITTINNNLKTWNKVFE